MDLKSYTKQKVYKIWRVLVFLFTYSAAQLEIY
jgi:hypothetical protein